MMSYVTEYLRHEIIGKESEDQLSRNGESSKSFAQQMFAIKRKENLSILYKIRLIENICSEISKLNFGRAVQLAL